MAAYAPFQRPVERLGAALARYLAAPRTALGSGDPTRAICSTLIADAFQAVRYPILPLIERRPRGDPSCPDCVDEILHVRHHRLFVPRDFDVSPCFEIVKPSLAGGFDPQALVWSDRELFDEVPA